MPVDFVTKDQQFTAISQVSRQHLFCFVLASSGQAPRSLQIKSKQKMTLCPHKATITRAQIANPLGCKRQLPWSYFRRSKIYTRNSTKQACHPLILASRAGKLPHYLCPVRKRKCSQFQFQAYLNSGLSVHAPWLVQADHRGKFYTINYCLPRTGHCCGIGMHSMALPGIGLTLVGFTTQHSHCYCTPKDLVCKVDCCGLVVSCELCMCPVAISRKYGAMVHKIAQGKCRYTHQGQTES